MNTNQRTADFYTLIRERQSIRQYDPSVSISEDELKEIIGEAILAPSSSNLQPWRFVVVTDPDVKQKLFPIAYNQKQVLDAAATLILLGDTEAYHNADKIYSLAVKNGMPQEVKDSYVPRLLEMYPNMDRETARGVALIDGGLVAMQFMLAAKAHGYDTVPMGGFSAEQLVEAFDIPSHYVPVMLISVGKADGAGFPKTRLSVDEVTSWNSISGLQD
ncbi:nitroreductase family protein [Bacillus horti]|uniref:Nitroreductase n=1 Tax=Caldalkalibacillus horti TaxID=77523 RepID=A0ABT9VWG9_9BACI|nr:nitroreductase family protein [Bacillus horti]MDQ0165318.1 nitroreductase [Bacillus horti]